MVGLFFSSPSVYMKYLSSPYARRLFNKMKGEGKVRELNSFSIAKGTDVGRYLVVKPVCINPIGLKEMPVL